MKRLILGVAAALMLGAGQAAADGLPDDRGEVWSPPEGPEVGIWRWTGFYAGVGIGGGGLEVEATDQTDGEGVLGTVALGYDRQFGPRWVAGVFADYDFSDITAEANNIEDEHNYSWSVGARLGALVTPKTLLYGTAGYTQAEFELTGFDADTFDGYFVGAGVEHMLRENWALKLEYRYSDYEGDEVDADASLHTGRVVLSYKFGGPRY